jgi:hypothetical protein
MLNWKILALLAVLITPAIGPARADEAQDFLASVKAQAAAAKTDLAKVKAKAVEDLQRAQQVTLETRTTCQQLVTVAEELVTAENDAKIVATQLKAAQTDANLVVAAARVRKVEESALGRHVRPIEVPSVDLTQVDEAPHITRARVVEVCKGILSKPASVAPVAPATQPSPQIPAPASVSPTGKGKKK